MSFDIFEHLWNHYYNQYYGSSLVVQQVKDPAILTAGAGVTALAWELLGVGGGEAALKKKMNTFINPKNYFAASC